MPEAESASAAAPPVLMVCGVSGSGKTTVGRLLAQRLAWPFQEGDALHPPENIRKMAAGRPLDDADRRPWLAAVARWVDGQRAARMPGVITCSALKRAYRDALRAGRPQLRLLFLRMAEPAIAARLAGRHGHFMPPSLLHSQFEALQAPGADEDALVVDAGGGTPEQVAAAVLDWLGAGAGSRAGA